MMGEGAFRLFCSSVPQGGNENVTGILLFSSTLSIRVNDFPIWGVFGGFLLSY
jgi:hypothetical protein